MSDTGSNDNKSTLISHNIMVNGRRTSIRLEKEMWMGLKDIAVREKCKVHDICSQVADRKKDGTSLTAAIRVFIMAYYQAAATEEGHERAGHGRGPRMVAGIIRAKDKQPYYGLRQFKNYTYQ